MIHVCPKCDVGLLTAHFKEMQVDYCERCHGLWLDDGELEELMTRTGASTSDPLLNLLAREPGAVPPGQKHLCPRCDKPLTEIHIAANGTPSLTLDRCAGHGLWFDAMELQQLLAMFPPETGAARTLAFLNELFGSHSTTPKEKQQ